MKNWQRSVALPPVGGIVVLTFHAAKVTINLNIHREREGHEQRSTSEH